MHGPVLFLVPARAGSRRLPGKNLVPLAGIPLVARAVRTARRAARLLPGDGHRVVVSTDCPEIAGVARAWGAEVPFLRPAHLSDDQAGSVDVALHALDALGGPFAGLALVQPTSPLTLPEDLVTAVHRFLAGDGEPVVTVAAAKPPAWTQRLAEGVLTPVAAEAEGPFAAANGACYVVAPERLRRTRLFEEPGATRAVMMPAQRSVDVDTAADLQLAAALLAAREVEGFELAGRRIGAGAPCLVIAEAGVNHDGDVAEAHRLIDAAAEAGADAVKFQTWITEALVRPGAPRAAYQERNDPGSADQFAMLKALELPFAEHSALKRHAEDRGLLFLSTPDDLESARFLIELGLPALKVGSAELTNLPYLRALAALGRPLLISTGMGTLLEVAQALDAVADAAEVKVALFHAVSSYPAPVGELNLRAITTLRQAFGVPVGLSDHSVGATAALCAVGLGLPLLEKHLTRDRSRRGPDHAASADPAQFAALVRELRAAESALGDGVKAPTPSEAGTVAAVRRVLVYARPLPAGHRLAPGDLLALRCGEPGLPPCAADELPGRVLARSVAAGAVTQEGDLT
jgi:N-acetylneuraminate synthase/N,N'-diacetyllegionaminate synthase